MGLEDGASGIRKGEEIDAKNLEAFLKAEVPDLDGDMTLFQFPGGHSNLTYLIRMGDREMVLQRPPIGAQVASAHDMGREYRVLKALSPVFSQAPAPVAYTEDRSIIGCPFLVMERLKGVVIRKEIPEALSLSADDMKTLCRNIVRTQYKLHDIDYIGIGLETLGKPQGYMKRQVEGWSNRYRKALTPDVPEGKDIMDWLDGAVPDDSEKPGIVHGDFKLDNLVLNGQVPTEITGILDWEMATIGDPLADLAYTLIFWPEEAKPYSDTTLPSMPGCLIKAVCREELVSVYEELAGRSVGNLDFYYGFNFFRLAVIIQQIYYRYYKGLTKDARFAGFVFGVNLLMEEAAKIMKRAG